MNKKYSFLIKTVKQRNHEIKTLSFDGSELFKCHNISFLLGNENFIL